MAANPYLTSAERAVLEHARVGIAGAGGLGSNCAMLLVRSGIRRLVIADFDCVGASNLNRQFFFADQIGQPKVAALEVNLRRIEPELELALHQTRVTPDNAAALFGGCDIVVEAFDGAADKRMLLEELRRLNLVAVSASGLAGWGGAARMKIRKLGGGRLYLAGDAESEVENDGPLRPMAPRVMLAATLEANCVIAHLLGLEP